MRLGLALPQYGRLGQTADVAGFAAAAEGMGYTSLWVGDRILTPVSPSDYYRGGTAERPYPPEFTTFLDPLVTLAVAATATTTARLGTSTLNATWHPPLLLGRSLTSLDVVSGGRLDAGFGIGWLRDEYTANGVGWAGRGARLEEILDVLDALWTTNPVEHHGKLWDIPESIVDLRPMQRPRPPVLLGGFTPAALDRVGRRADGWLAVRMPPTVHEHAWGKIRQAAEAAGRDPDAIRRELRIALPAEAPLSDAAAQVAEARRAGMDGAFVDLHFVAGTGAEALDLAAELKTLVDRG